MYEIHVVWYNGEHDIFNGDYEKALEIEKNFPICFGSQVVSIWFKRV